MSFSVINHSTPPLARQPVLNWRPSSDAGIQPKSIPQPQITRSMPQYEWIQPLERSVNRGFAAAEAKARRTLDRHGAEFSPMFTREGVWDSSSERWTHWCDGFFPGILWLLADELGSDRWRTDAERATRPLEPRKHDRAVHDLGFLFLPTYLHWFERTGDRQFEDVVIAAGQTLALRFNDKGRFLRSFVAPDSLFIDIMMNVPIIFEAAQRTNDRALHDLAAQHCRTTERFLVRPDGGTAHEGIFDLETGRFLRESTQQGFGPDSTWTRGLAWSLHGFAEVFRLTRDARDLDVARRNAACYLRRVDETMIPPWDFDAPATDSRQDDSSAAAIAADGLLLLATLVDRPDERDRYLIAASRTLEALCGPRYLAIDEPEWDGILKHGVYHLHKNLGVDESVIWGDYFFVKALARARALARSVAHSSPH
jgi:unsaturated chondroitin disaccharide hydrolase